MSDQLHDDPQPLVAHLTELRDRLLRALLSVLLIFFSNSKFDILLLYSIV